MRIAKPSNHQAQSNFLVSNYGKYKLNNHLLLSILTMAVLAHPQLSFVVAYALVKIIALASRASGQTKPPASQTKSYFWQPGLTEELLGVAAVALSTTATEIIKTDFSAESVTAGKVALGLMIALSIIAYANKAVVSHIKTNLAIKKLERE